MSEMIKKRNRKKGSYTWDEAYELLMKNNLLIREDWEDKRMKMRQELLPGKGAADDIVVDYYSLIILYEAEDETIGCTVVRASIEIYEPTKEDKEATWCLLDTSPVVIEKAVIEEPEMIGGEYVVLEDVCVCHEKCIINENKYNDVHTTDTEEFTKPIEAIGDEKKISDFEE